MASALELRNTISALEREAAERIRAQEQLEAKVEELRLLNEALGEQKKIMLSLLEDLHASEEKLGRSMAELKRSNKELEQFAQILAHDLKEPLRTVRSLTELLAGQYKGRLDADADQLILLIVDGAGRMQALIDDLLAYSRAGHSGAPLQAADCNEIVDRVRMVLHAAIEETRAEVSRDALPTLRADASQLAQVFQNLIANAIKFHGAEPPRVHVSAARKGPEWRISVRDNGIGIDPRYASKLFIMFQRLHGRDEYPGTGIGLAICKKIVERHGGRIWLESEPGQGATFHFTLPAAGDGNAQAEPRVENGES